MRRYVWMILCVIALAVPMIALAQRVPVDAADTLVLLPHAGYFFAALVAGLILALAFQLILTNLSVAAGLNVLGNVAEDARRKVIGYPDKDKGKHSSTSSTALQISNAFGMWTLITATISLFFAGWLATELSLTANATIGAVLGLVIWGLFYLVMTTIETSAVSSLTGSLVRMASTGLRNAYQTVTGMFGKSTEDRAADTTHQIVQAVREEIFGDADDDEIRDRIQKFVSDIKPEPADPRRIRVEIEKLLEDTEIRAVVQQDPNMLNHEVIVAELHTKGMEQSRARALADHVMDAVGKIREEAKAPKDPVAKVADAAMRVAGVPAGQATSTRQKIEAFLANTGKEELNPDAIKHELELLLHDPQEGMHALRERLSHFDRSTVSALLSQRQDMSPDEANRIVDQVDNIVQQLMGRFQSTRDSVVGKLRDTLSRFDGAEFDVHGIGRDFKRLLHDPKGGTEALAQRLKSLDRQTLKQMIASRRDVSEQDAERILERMENARDEMLHKIERVKVEVDARLTNLKLEAVRQADQARKVAATAAWWAFTTAVISGAAAVVGGIVAARTV